MAILSYMKFTKPTLLVSDILYLGKGENKSKGKGVEGIMSPIVPNWGDHTMSFEDWKEMLTGGTWERNSDKNSASS